jgi:mannose-1-phosphate guanylyltransferase/mannose-6-phosphate isomerase
MTEERFEDLHPVVLAGGSGTRLWPASRAAFPKHVARLIGDRSLLQRTLDRLLSLAPASRIVTVGAAAQAELLRAELAAVDPDLVPGLLVEPAARNTAAAIALAARHVAALHGGDRILYVCPSDHLVRHPDVLQTAVAAALPAVRAGALATFGIRPERPETGFGYIRGGDPVGAGREVRRVREFVEKPPFERARAMVESGEYLWNSGMFLFRADRLLEELADFEPAIAAGVHDAFAAMREQGAPAPPEALWRRIPEQPIDRAVMERSRSVVVVPCDPGWSDLGSWHALWELGERDRYGNLFTGDVEAESVRGCLVRADSRFVALAGVEDLVVVDTPDALFVGRREDSDALKRLVGRIAASRRPEAVEPPLRFRDGARESLLARRPGYEVWELLLEAGTGPVTPARGDAGTLWTVVEGEVETRAGQEIRRFGPGSAFGAASVTELRSAGPTPARLVGTRRLRSADPA